MQIRFIFLISFLFISFIGFTQNPERDSLINLLPSKNEDTTKVDLYRDIGITYIYENPPASIPYFKQAISLAKKLNFNAGLERSYAAHATAFVLHGKYDSSLAYVDTAIFYANKVKDVSRQALVYLNRADVYVNLQRFKDALKSCDTAMVYAERSGNKDRLARIFDIMCGIYTEQNQFPQALEFLDKATKLYRELDNRQMLALSFMSKAIILKNTNQADKAIPLLREAIQMAEEIGDVQNLSAYNSELSEIYAGTKNYSEATLLADKALKYSVLTGNRRQESVIHALFANIYKEQNFFAKAVVSARKAYDIIVEEKDLHREQSSAQLLADLYAKTGDMTQAYFYQRISNELNDSLLQQRFDEETLQLQTSFQVSEKNKEIQLLNKDKELQEQKLTRQRLLLFSALLLAILAIGGIVLLINRNRLRQQMKELELRNQIAADLHDEVGSSLSSIHMLSQMAVAKDVNEDATRKNILAKMSINAKETMDKMGDIVWMIKPGKGEETSLKQRMERFVYEICEPKNIKVDMELGKLETAKFTMQQRKNLYLIFKEAVNNAVKYSDTEKMEISIAEQNKLYILTIKDYGKGFNTALIAKGNGLDNMQHRAKDLGGKLDIVSSQEKGTVITLQMPV